MRTCGVERQHLRLQALAFQLVEGDVEENGVAVKGLEEDAFQNEGVLELAHKPVVFELREILGD